MAAIRPRRASRRRPPVEMVSLTPVRSATWPLLRGNLVRARPRAQQGAAKSPHLRAAQQRAQPDVLSNRWPAATAMAVAHLDATQARTQSAPTCAAIKRSSRPKPATATAQPSATPVQAKRWLALLNCAPRAARSLQAWRVPTQTAAAQWAARPIRTRIVNPRPSVVTETLILASRAMETAQRHAPRQANAGSRHFRAQRVPATLFAWNPS